VHIGAGEGDEERVVVRMQGCIDVGAVGLEEGIEREEWDGQGLQVSS
jgi:hypothetical protein